MSWDCGPCLDRGIARREGELPALHPLELVPPFLARLEFGEQDYTDDPSIEEGTTE